MFKRASKGLLSRTNVKLFYGLKNISSTPERGVRDLKIECTRGVGRATASHRGFIRSLQIITSDDASPLDWTGVLSLLHRLLHRIHVHVCMYHMGMRASSSY